MYVVVCGAHFGVIHSFTPSGVEHYRREIVEQRRSKVIHSFTPSGVEHAPALDQLVDTHGDSFVYAVRR